MKKLTSLAGAGMIAASALTGYCRQKADSEVKQPNIIFFLVDDMGWQDTAN